jgi:hypothetical protein
MNRITSLATGMAVFCTGFAAHAERPFTEERAQISGHVAVGIDLEDDEVNPYGFGLGARGGYTLDPNVYIGGVFDFFFGGSEEVRVLGIRAGEVSARAWLFQAEVGYDFGVSRSVVLRPKMGLGMIQIAREACAEVANICDDDSDGEFAFALGLEVPIDLDGLYVAPEMRFNIVDDASALIFAAGIGGAF